MTGGRIPMALGLTAGLVAAGLLAAGLGAPGPAARESDPAGDSAPSPFALAPVSLGNPFAAATLRPLRQPEPAPDAAPSVLPEEDDGRQVQTLTVSSGDTLLGVLMDAGVGRATAHEVVTALGRVLDPRSIRPGQEITIAYALDPYGTDEPRLDDVVVSVDFERDVRVSRSDAGDFAAAEVRKEITSEVARGVGRITSSLYEAAVAAGVPAAVVVEMIRAFSWDVDFQRDIQPDDAFEAVYERFLDRDGQPVASGALQFASLTLSGTRLSLYRHTTVAGVTDYFNPKGESVRKALLRTPIDGARLSSGFGSRLHPILGYTTMHRGVDFAAPTGTPIYAAGDGTVEYAGRHGAYGNYVRIRHTGEYSTAYAHLNGFGRGLRQGQRVRQGQTIGYVGSTGRSTGPHLHFEILRHGTQVNPLAVKMPSGEKLAGRELARFQEARAALERRIADMPLAVKVTAGR